MKRAVSPASRTAVRRWFMVASSAETLGGIFAPQPGSALRLKCWVGRGRLPEALRRATRQALILVRRGASKGNGRCKTDARATRVGGEKAPFARGAARARGGCRAPRRTRPRGGRAVAGAGVRRPQRRARPRPLRGLGGQGHGHRLLSEAKPS